MVLRASVEGMAEQGTLESLMKMGRPLEALGLFRQALRLSTNSYWLLKAGEPYLEQLGHLAFDRWG